MDFNELLRWANMDCKVWPGGFREKDLNLIFQQCQQKFAILAHLKQEKDDLAAKLALLGSHPFSPSSLSHKPPAPDPVKKKAVEYKFKCPIKSCGKIMTSEPSYHSHMKRHSDKKPTKRDPATDGQDHRFDA